MLAGIQERSGSQLAPLLHRLSRGRPERVGYSRAGLVWMSILGVVDLAASARADQPRLVCDLTPVLSGTFEGDRLRTDGPVRENDERVRLTFSAMDPKAGTARMIVGEDVSGELDVAMTSEPGVIGFLVEKSRASKMLVTVQTKVPVGPQGWPAIMSQHGWPEGTVTLRALSGACRLRAA